MATFAALRDLLRRSGTSFTPSINPFLQIDVEALAKELRLDERGTEQGKMELPASSSENLDEVEQQILEVVENEARTSHAEYLNEINVLEGRLASLDLAHRFTQARSAAVSAIGDFKVAAHAAEDRLASLKREVTKSQRFLDTFCSKNGLIRPAHEAHTGAAFWGIVLIALLGEAAANSLFLRINDNLGLLGGVSIALAIAVVNVLVGVLSGRHILPLLNHRQVGWKTFGGFLLCIYVAIAAWINLTGAHYRALKGEGAHDPAGAAFYSVLADPLNVHDYLSGLLLLLGLVASLGALYAGYRADDPYPGYGKVYREHKRILEDYADAVDDAFEDLTTIRDDANELCTELMASLARDRREHDAITLSKGNIFSQYQQRSPYLNSVGNRLLAIYRNSNAKARTTPPPDRFQHTWVMRALAQPIDPSDGRPQEDVRAGVENANRSLEEAMNEISIAFNAHVDSFPKIDDLIGEPI